MPLIYSSQDLPHTCCVEFFPGDPGEGFPGFKNDGSVYVMEEEFEPIFSLFSRHVPDFSMYDNFRIGRATWLPIIAELRAVTEGKSVQLTQALVEWLEDSLKRSDIIFLIGF